ncbi:bactericidal permeability-increasing protein-like [Denticeps clupeoides]|nr:bactericidal permeability-increasing protein-like [Denticeps clupeoides]
MSLWRVLALLMLLPATQTTNAGVKVRITQKGLDYGRQIAIATLLEKLKTIKVPDLSGAEKVSPIGKVQYSLTGIQITALGLPKSAVGLVPGTGISLSIGQAYIRMHGNWKVQYLHIVKDSGSFDLFVNGLAITSGIGLKSDETGRPEVNIASCADSISSASVKFRGGASWLYSLFSSYIDKAIRDTLQKQICPLVAAGISEVNPHLKTLNVLAKVDKYAVVEYSMVQSPVITQSSIDFSLKGEFYSIGKRKEPPFSAKTFSLPPLASNMLYIGVSEFTANSAGFTYNNAGALSLFITDDMIPPSSPIRLNTRTFGAFIPQIAKRYPRMMMKLLVKMVKAPSITFQQNITTIQASGTITAYAIQPNTTLSPLFILNVGVSFSSLVYVTGVKLSGTVSLNKMDMTLGQSYVGPFQVKSLDKIVLMVLKMVVIPKVNARLQQGFPLPSIGKMNLVNTRVQVLKDFMLIGTDVQFTG